jgi:hypothetical protein
MKSLGMLVLSLAAVLALVVAVKAAEDKKETLEGTITCSKCDLKLDTDKCHTVIKTKDGTVYYFDEKAGKANHKKICTSPMDGKVTGTVSEKDGKKIVTIESVEFK